MKSQKLFWVFGILILGIIIFLPRYSKLQELKDRNKELEEAISKEKLKKEMLGEELARIKEDTVYQEELIRQRLGVVRPGEVVYKLEEDSGQ